MPTGTYRPKNYADSANGGNNDNFPAPAPAPSANASLGAAFNNTNPNGTWSLYVIDDASVSGKSPAQWAARAIAVYHARQADRVVAEVNQGGAMVEAVLREVDATVAYRALHASRGKRARAEPVAALYEQGRVSHAGRFPALEDELCTWRGDGDESPDRLDALVWAMSELMLGKKPAEPRIWVV